MKEGYKNGRCWVKSCKKLGICRQTAQRVIDFAYVVEAYPRIIVVGLSFSTIMGNYDDIQNALSVNTTLRDRLKEPLRGINIRSHDVVFGETNLPSGKSDPPQDLPCLQQSWKRGWKYVDKIVDSEDQTAANDDDESTESDDNDEWTAAGGHPNMELDDDELNEERTVTLER